jgi:hypothetical protein
LSLRVERTPLPATGSRVDSPFSLNPEWKARRDAARRWEIMVGASSYLVLTKKGNAMLVAFIAVLLGGWWLAAVFTK